jgi:hypothetical protein
MKHRLVVLISIATVFVAIFAVLLAGPASARMTARTAAMETAPDKPDFQSKTLAVGFSPASPAFRVFSVDVLGNGAFAENPILKEPPAASPLKLEAKGDGTFVYTVPGAQGSSKPAWTVICADYKIVLRSEYTGGGGDPFPFVLAFDQKANHATLLGLMKAGERRMALPCLLHMPDRGSVRITADAPDLALDYDARRSVKVPFVRVAFPAATAARPRVEYTLEAAAIYPRLPGIESDHRYDGFRRSFLNIFQVNPRVQMLANNASSDPVPFTVYMNAMVAAAAPPLAPGLTALDLVRMTVDRYLAGAKGYGLVGYATVPGDADLVAWKAPWNSLDTYPSLLQSACIYALEAHDRTWARANYGKILEWARLMMAGDTNGDGLIEHPHTGNSGDRATADKRPSNWWDTINFGHDDAYSNALAYKACLQFADLAKALDRTDDAKIYAGKAALLKAAYKKAFLNPATGLLAGWRSKDGKLHDYAFTFVNGIAVTYGLLDKADANAVMDRLLAKMKEVGFTNFRLGLPGNLTAVRKEDYVFHNWAGAKGVGEPSKDDGSDAFQFYENGGTTACYAYFTIKALYSLGRVEDARRIFYPMLDGFAAGEFQGFCDDGKSKDWRDWKGGCHGYEGLLCDGYLTLLAVLDDFQSKK